MVVFFYPLLWRLNFFFFFCALYLKIRKCNWVWRIISSHSYTLAVLDFEHSVHNIRTIFNMLLGTFWILTTLRQSWMSKRQHNFHLWVKYPFKIKPRQEEVIESDNLPSVSVMWLFYRCACIGLTLENMNLSLMTL